MKTLSNAKNLAMPWYLLNLRDKNHEKSTIKTVPEIRAI
jgi:hypothetical protein